jgi:hypothetical protein
MDGDGETGGEAGGHRQVAYRQAEGDEEQQDGDVPGVQRPEDVAGEGERVHPDAIPGGDRTGRGQQ